MRTNSLISLVAVASLLTACTGESGGNDEGGETGAVSTTGMVDTSAGPGGVTTASDESTGGGSTGGGSGSSDGGSGFIIQPDGGSVNIECSVWDQDCMDGQKCMPWANDGGNSWNATKCTPLDPEPAQPGDPCLVEGGGVSGIDNCDLASMCWDVDPETNEGTCVAFCTGSETAPICNNPNQNCTIVNDGVLILCLPKCDPLLQDCAEGQGCYRVFDNFTCAPDASGADEGAYPDPCAFINACDPGLECSNPETVPGCVAEGCCSPYCDLSVAENTCPGAAEGQECVPAFAEGSVPPGYENVGNCAIPA